MQKLIKLVYLQLLSYNIERSEDTQIDHKLLSKSWRKIIRSILTKTSKYGRMATNYLTNYA